MSSYTVRLVGVGPDGKEKDVVVNDDGEVIVSGVGRELLTSDDRATAIQLEMLGVLKCICLQLACLTGEDITPTDIGDF